jgi:hypothetical protein
VRRCELALECAEVVRPDRNVDLAPGAGDDETARLADRVEPDHGQHLRSRLECSHSGQVLLEVFERLDEVVAKAVKQLLGRDAHVVRRRAVPDGMHDPL